MTDPAPYSVPKEPGRWRAITLAVIVHIALLAFLWIGIRWQNETPVGVEAEIWSPQNQEAAPRPEPQVVEKKPEPQSEQQPAPKPVVQEIPKPAVAEPLRENPQIVLEQEKKRKAQEKREREREEHEKQAKLKQQKLEHEREEKQKQAEKERLEKQKAEALAKKEKEAEQAKKLAAEKLAAEKKRKQEAADAAAAEQRHAEDMKRMLAQAGSGGTGNAAATQGSRADSSYTQKVGARIRSNTVFNVPEGLAGNPAVEFAIELLPDGSIRSLNKVKSSGVPGFDEAVQRAIGKSAPFPPDQSGRVPASFNVVHHPKDQ